MEGKSSISSLSLFHFTDSVGTLGKILTSKCFHVNECEEHHWGGYKFSVPMVCFCDIPLSKIAYHTTQYGCYGIGLSEEWANSNKLCSVIYVRNNSELSKWTDKKLKDIATKPNCVVSAETIYILSRIKKYKGKISNTKGEKTNKKKFAKFYDEREWRFVPNNLKLQNIQIGKENDKFEFQDPSYTKLQFNLSDIEYLIVKNESERINIINVIDKIKDEKEALAILKSKIQTIQQIKRDF